MSLAACIRNCPSTTRRPWLAKRLLPATGSSTEASASLTWRNRGVVLVTPEQQHDPGSRPDAADADHLARRGHVAIAAQEVAPGALERGAIGAQQRLELGFDRGRIVGLRQLLDRDDQKRVVPIRISPLTRWVSRSRARMLSFEWALATLFLTALRRCLGAPCPRGQATARRPAPHTPRFES